MNEKKVKATKAIMAMEGIPENSKLDAVILVQRGYDPEMVIRAVQQIADSFKKLAEMSVHLDNRERLAQYHRDNSDPKLTDGS